ncbi:hypothetical protein V6N13_128856 [Hibiscus sabdariffa]
MDAFRTALEDCSLSDIGYQDVIPRWHFKFEAAWLIEDSCEPEVQKLWVESSGFLPDRLRYLSRVIEGDSLTIIKKLQASSSDLSELSAVIFEVQAKAKTLRNCSFNFIPRGSNQVAHIIAKDFSLNSGDRFWVEEIPSSALRAAAFDCRNLRPP